jgi:hypothetical protein
MRSLRTLTALAASAALLAGCGIFHAAQQTATAAFHTSFRASFKTSFMRACTSQGASDKTCGCIEGKIESSKTDDQLMKMRAGSEQANTMVNDATQACLAQK